MRKHLPLKYIVWVKGTAPIHDLFPELTYWILHYWIQVSIGHLQRMWHADRGRLLLRTPGPVPLGLAYVLLFETNPFPNLSLFYRTMLFEYPSVLSRFCLKGYWHDWWSLFTISFYPKLFNNSSMKPSVNRTTTFTLMVHWIELHSAFEENKQKNANF